MHMLVIWSIWYGAPDPRAQCLNRVWNGKKKGLMPGDILMPCAQEEMDGGLKKKVVGEGHGHDSERRQAGG